jgi:hypothetical protein
MICLKLPELAAWPAAGACGTAELRISCSDINRIEGRRIRRNITDLVVMLNPLAKDSAFLAT